jgi:hypothetical protein
MDREMSESLSFFILLYFLSLSQCKYGSLVKQNHYRKPCCLPTDNGANARPAAAAATVAAEIQL